MIIIRKQGWGGKKGRGGGWIPRVAGRTEAREGAGLPSVQTRPGPAHTSEGGGGALGPTCGKVKGRKKVP